MGINFFGVVKLGRLIVLVVRRDVSESDVVRLFVLSPAFAMLGALLGCQFGIGWVKYFHFLI